MEALSTEDLGKERRTAVAVELTGKTEARVAAILRQLLKTYDGRTTACTACHRHGKPFLPGPSATSLPSRLHQGKRDRRMAAMGRAVRRQNPW